MAQFLVAKRVRDSRLKDDGWGDFDVLTPEGIKDEVKSSGYLQSWQQAGPSKIVFSGLIGWRWSVETGYAATPAVRADVFVFAVHTCHDPDASDPLDLKAWAFYVLPATNLRELGQKSLSLPRVQSLGGSPLAWPDLRAAVLSAAGR